MKPVHQLTSEAVADLARLSQHNVTLNRVLAAESEVGRGSTFFFTLPVASG